MATKREYAYFLKGNKIAITERDVNVRQNPEDFTSNIGRIYSRNDLVVALI